MKLRVAGPKQGNEWGWGGEKGRQGDRGRVTVTSHIRLTLLVVCVKVIAGVRSSAPPLAAAHHTLDAVQSTTLTCAEVPHLT